MRLLDQHRPYAAVGEYLKEKGMLKFAVDYVHAANAGCYGIQAVVDFWYHSA